MDNCRGALQSRDLCGISWVLYSAGDAADAEMTLSLIRDYGPILNPDDLSGLWEGRRAAGRVGRSAPAVREQSGKEEQKLQSRLDR